MDKNELERLENKLKVDDLSDQEVQSLFSEIKRLKAQLHTAQIDLEDSQGGREMMTNLFVFVLNEDNRIIEVPSRIVKNLQYIKTNHHFVLEEGKDFKINKNIDSDTYMLDFSSYMNITDIFDEEDEEIVTIYYSSWS